MRSASFSIGDGVYRDVMKHAMRAFFYQRAGFEKKAGVRGKQLGRQGEPSGPRSGWPDTPVAQRQPQRSSCAIGDQRSARRLVRCGRLQQVHDWTAQLRRHPVARLRGKPAGLQRRLWHSRNRAMVSRTSSTKCDGPSTGSGACKMLMARCLVCKGSRAPAHRRQPEIPATTDRPRRVLRSEPRRRLPMPPRSSALGRSRNSSPTGKPS